MAQTHLDIESKLVLLVVAPLVAVDLGFATHTWATQCAPVAIWTLGLSALLGLVTWKLRAATPAAALMGAVITASLMFATVRIPYRPEHTALIPVLAVAVLAWAATRVGRGLKQRLGTAERQDGRAAAQVAANLGVAALLSTPLAHSLASGTGWLHSHTSSILLAAMLAALAEAAADTVSSELGQVLGGQPWMITTLHRARAGQDGAISAAGTLAGAAAAAVVAGCGTWALHGGWKLFAVSFAGGVFGCLFDSLLGATLERRGWLNNDAVNFLSTAAAAVVALCLLAAHG